MKHHERRVPDVDVTTFGPRNHVYLVNHLRGDEMAKFFPLANWRNEIEAAIVSLPPLRRFVVEARTRGKTQREVADLVGWHSATRVQQVESHAYRLMGLREKSGALRDLMNQFRRDYFCEFAVEENEREPVNLGCRTFMVMVKRCKFCRRKDGEGENPRCKAKPLPVVQLELGL
jgi:hypothetical protein